VAERRERKGKKVMEALKKELEGRKGKVRS
jgi:hypothetical protein